jgi:hypothetical protein
VPRRGTHWRLRVPQTDPTNADPQENPDV